MIQKNKVHMLGLFAAMVMMGNEMPHAEREYVKPKETDEQRKRRLVKAEIERAKVNGLKQFFYGENSVWAINKKNADRKARSKHWV
jgi:hypothetical protein